MAKPWEQFQTQSKPWEQYTQSGVDEQPVAPIAQPVQPAVEEMPMPLYERAKQILGGSFDEASEIMSGKYNQPKAFDVLHSAGEIGSGVGEVAGEAIIRGLKAITPDEIEEKIGSAGRALLESEVGQTGLQYAQEGGDKWESFKQQFPTTARTLSSILGIAEGVAVGGVAGGLAREGVEGAVKGVGRTMEGRQKLDVDPIFADVGDDSVIQQLGEGVRKVAEQRKQEIGDMFTEAAELGKDTSIVGSSARDAVTKLESIKKDLIGDDDIKAVDNAISRIKGMQKGQTVVLDAKGNPVTGGGLNLNELEGLRRSLGVGYGEGAVRRVLEDVIGGAIDSGNLKGNLEAGKRWKEARQAYGQYKDTFDNPKNMALIKNIVEKDMTPETLASNILGSGRVKTSREAAKKYDDIVKVLGASADPQLKSAIVNKIFNFSQHASGDIPDGVWLQKVAQEVRDLKTQNKSLWKKFSKDEQFALMKMATTAERAAEGGLINKAVDGVLNLASGFMRRGGLKTDLKLPSPIAPKQIVPASELIEASRLRKKDLNPDKYKSPTFEAVKEKLKEQRGAIKVGDDLPMDTQSRMQRAREQGFDVDNPVYHGTTKSFGEFNPKLSNTQSGTGVPEGAVVFSSSPEIASGYAQNVLNNDKFMELNEKYKNLSNKRDRLAVERKTDTKEFDNLQRDINTVVNQMESVRELVKDNVYEARGANVIKSLYKTENPLNVKAKGEITADRFWDDITVELPNGDTFKGNINDLAKRAKEDGYDSLSVDNVVDSAGGTYKPATTTFVFDPKNIRSTQAKFDPKKKDSANILAGTAGAITAGSLANKEKGKK